MNQNCGICLETYTKKTRVKVTCQYCPSAACRLCQQNYLLNTYDDPHCYSCKQGWSSDFMGANFPVIFRTKTLRLHRRKILLEREKSHLPAMQIFVEARKKIESIYVLITEVYRRYTEQREYLNKLKKEQLELKVNMHKTYSLCIDETNTKDQKKSHKAEYKKVVQDFKSKTNEISEYTRDHYNKTQIEYSNTLREKYHWERVYETGVIAGSNKKERREFLMRCPAEECRGFLSTAYKCGVCEKKTCSECLEVLGEEAHTCLSDAIETAKAIKNETRPCPKCGVRIYKIDGCDQMWCTVDGCGTAFSWESGAIVTGRVHNPHYYEWLRRAGGGTAPREIGDIPCGGVPDVFMFTGIVNRNKNISGGLKKILYDIHMNVVEFEDRLRDYPSQPPALSNKEINVLYLMNRLTEEGWMRSLEHGEAKFNRKKEIGQILQMLVIAAADLLREIAIHCSDENDITIESWLESEAVVALENLRVYTNESFNKLSHSTRMAVPQIKDTWRWIPVRAVYKRANRNEIVSEAAEVEEPIV